MSKKQKKDSPEPVLYELKLDFKSNQIKVGVNQELTLNDSLRLIRDFTTMVVDRQYELATNGPYKDPAPPGPTSAVQSYVARVVRGLPMPEQAEAIQ